MTPSEWFSILLLFNSLIIVSLIFVRRRSIARDRERQSGQVDRNVRYLTSQLQSLADDIDAKLCQRVAELNSLIDDAKLQADDLRGLLTRQGDDTKESTPSAISHESKPPESLATEICHLAQQGLDGDEIARQLGRPVGEILLVLRLQRGSTPTDA